MNANGKGGSLARAWFFSTAKKSRRERSLRETRRVARLFCDETSRKNRRIRRESAGGDRARNATSRVDTLFQVLLNHVSDRVGDRNGAFVILAALVPSVRFHRVKLDIFKNGNFGKSRTIR